MTIAFPKHQFCQFLFECLVVQAEYQFSWWDHLTGVRTRNPHPNPTPILPLRPNGVMDETLHITFTCFQLQLRDKRFRIWVGSQLEPVCTCRRGCHVIEFVLIHTATNSNYVEFCPDVAVSYCVRSIFRFLLFRRSSVCEAYDNFRHSFATFMLFQQLERFPQAQIGSCVSSRVRHSTNRIYYVAFRCVICQFKIYCYGCRKGQHSYTRTFPLSFEC